jgi:outer membrane receptor protein involved in Fe transport
MGFDFDGAQNLFNAMSAIGGITRLTREFIGPGIVIDQADGTIAPVSVDVKNADYGALFTDTFDMTPALSATFAGRQNVERIDLDDRLGHALTGSHTYSRFNPAGGLGYKLMEGLNLYAGYADANRAPTPAELSCASPSRPCSLANFFVGDPNLRQVVSHTIEAGLRGRLRPFGAAEASYQLGWFRTSLDDDIAFVNSPVAGRAFFRNIGATLRQGVEVDARLRTDRLLAWIAYSFTDATFQTGFTASSADNPRADPDGNIHVRPGNHLPGVLGSLLKMGMQYEVTHAWTVGGTLRAVSGQYLFGDEANLTPKVPGYVVIGLNTTYRVAPHVQLFALIDNALDQKYSTFGTFSPTSSVFIAQVPGASETRSYSPAASIAATAGVRVEF